MAQRVAQVSEHLTSKSGPSFGKIGHKNADDVVIVSAVRTAITRSKGGGFAGVHPEELLAATLKGVSDRVGIDKKLVEDIHVGNVRLPGAGAGLARMAMLKAGYPNDTSVMALNRQCSSGLQAIANIAGEIKSGVIDIGIGAGVESMGQDTGTPGDAIPPKDWVKTPGEIQDCLLPMGITSENVAKIYKVDRAKQDAFAAASYDKANKAQKAGLFKEEIIPVEVTKPDGSKVIVDRDDGIRPTTLEQLSKLRPAFTPEGASTAGNSSQVSDGSGAVLLARRSVAEKLGLPIIGKIVTFAVAGVPPKVMGIGPAFAIPKALSKAGISVSDVDIYEINEAFASQAVYSVEVLGIDPKKVNPKGGAIAIGHPLGATGARQISTLFTELKRTNKRIGVTSMCIGSGMGAAAVFERE
ncbi:3-ketoacyl-CoA thiolase peroxisomal A precursor [Gonapodya prolifera JEL478]|uniref:acetyl-CoA C-acyltransferase n=1 Tax=Gonapodya prolifera (strain JEL478) TaxID=1344416 RepID=A0A139AZA9_GONPJ|nr:3-ketoacyl-CoA thiolase peroxisomal A precursor [Gonapodya prolifera JEL478]|eukprot:KXS21815.1 3-ketoacyl-CoA thiolase peroxisomal A precursor [Gonapodya prolifera JEL478]